METCYGEPMGVDEPGLSERGVTFEAEREEVKAFRREAVGT
jgi:hypothetical protein